MGGSRWSADDWTSYKSTKVDTASSTADLYSARKMKSTSSAKTTLDPKGIVLRESRDSDANPNSTPVIVALDVTGSMGMIADAIARHLGTLMNEMLDRKPVTDPHVMFMGVGDVDYSSGRHPSRSYRAGDSAPLQVTQFEADIKIADQLREIYLEHGGGGNHCESYNLPWYFAAYHTATDAFEKRKKKGYLFTIGDEEIPYNLTKDHINAVLGSTPEFDTITNEDLLTAVRKMYNVYHIIVEEGSHCRGSAKNEVINGWNSLLGQQSVIKLSDHTKIAEVLISTMQIAEGATVDSVIKSWSGSTSMTVAHATNSLTQVDKADKELVRL